MFKTTSSNGLRTILLFDAGTCLVMGLLLIVGNALLADLTAIPSAVLLYAGGLLLPIAGFMAIVALKALHSRPALWLIIAGNGLWVLASIALIAGPWITPNLLGYGFIGLQAVAVFILMELEYTATRNAARAIA